MVQEWHRTKSILPSCYTKNIQRNIFTAYHHNHQRELFCIANCHISQNHLLVLGYFETQEKSSLKCAMEHIALRQKVIGTYCNTNSEKGPFSFWVWYLWSPWRVVVTQNSLQKLSRFINTSLVGHIGCLKECLLTKRSETEPRFVDPNLSTLVLFWSNATFPQWWCLKMTNQWHNRCIMYKIQLWMVLMSRYKFLYHNF